MKPADNTSVDECLGDVGVGTDRGENWTTGKLFPLPTTNWEEFYTL